MATVRWTKAEDAQLRVLLAQGDLTYTQIADRLERTGPGCSQRAYKLGFTQKQPNKAGNRVRGQGRRHAGARWQKQTPYAIAVRTGLDAEPRHPIRLDLGPPPSLTAYLMGDPRPGRTPWASDQ